MVKNWRVGQFTHFTKGTFCNTTIWQGESCTFTCPCSSHEHTCKCRLHMSCHRNPSIAKRTKWESSATQWSSDFCRPVCDTAWQVSVKLWEGRNSPIFKAVTESRDRKCRPLWNGEQVYKQQVRVDQCPWKSLWGTGNVNEGKVSEMVRSKRK